MSDRYFVRVCFGHALCLAILLAVSSVVVLFGALDDVFSLRPAVKLAAQAAAASILLFADAGIRTVGSTTRDIWLAADVALAAGRNQRFQPD
jgi:UDP-N-acetylmuramyl pentapeptide phosphotransferase/UDP-N-acetylglucosamine-1-phosphate transferase